MPYFCLMAHVCGGDVAIENFSMQKASPICSCFTTELSSPGMISNTNIVITVFKIISFSDESTKVQKKAWKKNNTMVTMVILVKVRMDAG